VCPLEYRGCAAPGGCVTPKKSCILGVLGLKKTISSYSFDRIVLICGYIVERTNTKIPSSHFFCNFHLEPKLWRHQWRHFRFCKSCRRAMRIAPPVVNHRSVAASYFTFFFLVCTLACGFACQAYVYRQHAFTCSNCRLFGCNGCGQKPQFKVQTDI